MVNVKLTQLSALLILASGLVEANRNKKQKSVIQLICELELRVVQLCSKDQTLD